ncbi:MAG: DUF3570 domain-containing protein [Betaproteobacteria bacterium]|nr:DUF3570 domain-containing protein [Betaproteobacteria bacterium]
MHALTAAALALPGMMQPSSCTAQDNAAAVQFGQFQEGSRELYGVNSRFKPIESDSLQQSVWFSLDDRFKGQINYRQDTWSGATPIATAPREWRGNRSPAPDGVSGASPYLVPGSDLFLDAQTRQPLRSDGFGKLTGGVDTQLAHTLSGASRETRKQVDFSLRREWNETALDLSAGTSIENDYVSRFGGIGGQWDFNQKLTTFNLRMSYSTNRTRATLDHDATPYIFNACGNARCNFVSSTSHIEDFPGGKKVLHGDRRDWGAVGGITQVINQSTQVNASLGYTRNRGYLANPYKVVEVAFIDPDQQFLAPLPGVLYVNANALLEQRPELRNQWLWNVRLARYIGATDAGLHVQYSHSRDDWGIRPTLAAGGSSRSAMAGPSRRGFATSTQSAAGFYTPYLVTDQGQFSTRTDPATGQAITVPFDRTRLPASYSSDSRLSGYGALAGGLTLSKLFANGVTFRLGYEYYQHAGKLKWRGGGEGSYADFDSHLLSAALKLDLDTVASRTDSERSAGANTHASHGGHATGGGAAPAGVMFGHVLANAGDYMVGYRYMYSRQAGRVLRRSRPLDDAQLRINACDAMGCLAVPVAMSMHMHMLDLMVAPTDWLTLMFMPQFVDMNMSMRGLLNQAEQGALAPEVRALYQHHTLHGHTSGGIGDTGIYTVFKLFDAPGRQMHATVGFTAPTGNVGLKLRDTHQVDAGYDHYGMQLGSGTWDLNPSITYAGEAHGWSWGAQVSARSGCRSATGRDTRSATTCRPHCGPPTGCQADCPHQCAPSMRGTARSGANSKAHTTSCRRSTTPATTAGATGMSGSGSTTSPAAGTFAGTRIGVEWLHPVGRIKGDQLERRGTLNASWQYSF